MKKGREEYYRAIDARDVRGVKELFLVKENCSEKKEKKIQSISINLNDLNDEKNKNLLKFSQARSSFCITF